MSILSHSTFYDGSQQNRLFSCIAEKRLNLNILDNRLASLAQIEFGIDSGLQNSVIRKSVFIQHLLPNFRIGEDRLFILQALKSGFTFAFIDAVTVTYFVHDNNSSDTNLNEDNLEKRISAMKELLASYEQTFQLVDLDKQEIKALRDRLSEDYFWKLGYALYAQNSRYKEALSCMKIGLSYNFLKPKYYKTIVVTSIKALIYR
jgi:hypothetical protein